MAAPLARVTKWQSQDAWEAVNTQTLGLIYHVLLPETPRTASYGCPFVSSVSATLLLLMTSGTHSSLLLAKADPYIRIFPLAFSGCPV